MVRVGGPVEDKRHFFQLFRVACVLIPCLATATGGHQEKERQDDEPPSSDTHVNLSFSIM
jgi:hypothetical protein